MAHQAGNKNSVSAMFNFRTGGDYRFGCEKLDIPVKYPVRSYSESCKCKLVLRYQILSPLPLSNASKASIFGWSLLSFGLNMGNNFSAELLPFTTVSLILNYK